MNSEQLELELELELELANQENDEQARVASSLNLLSQMPDLLSPIVGKERPPVYSFGPEANFPDKLGCPSGADFRFHSDGEELASCQLVDLHVQHVDKRTALTSVTHSYVNGSLVFTLWNNLTPAKLIKQIGDTLVVSAATETTPRWEILSLESITVANWNFAISVDDLIPKVKVNFTGALKRDE